MSFSNQQIERLEEIQRRVCQYYKLDLADMTSRARPNRIAHPRMMAMFLVIQETDLSLAEIGERFGNRDHGTVIHARKRISEALEIKPELNDTIRKIFAGDDPAQLKLEI